MITEIILRMFRSVLQIALMLLPNSSPLPIQIQSSLNSMSTYFNYANKLLPIDTIFVIIGLGLLFESTILLFKLVNFAINKLRGSG